MNKRPTATQIGIDHIKHNIENGSWTAGMMIPSENTLSETLGISRTSVRTAIRQFIALGLLESRHGKGTFVTQDVLSQNPLKRQIITKNDSVTIHDVISFRILVEPASAAMAAINITDAELDELNYFIGKMNESIDDPESSLKYDLQYHKVIAKATRNKVLENALCTLFEDTLDIHLRIRLQLGKNPGLFYHQMILDALRQHNSSAAKKAMEEHIKFKQEQLMTLFG